MYSQELKELISNLHISFEKKDKEMQVEALLKLAEFHYNNDNFEKAKISLKQILDINSNVSNVNYYLALIEIAKENFEDAIKFLNKELEINPKNIYANQLKEKLRINSNFPFITLFLLFLNSLVFFFTFPKISLVDAIKFGVSNFNFGFFNAFSSLFFHINIYHFLINMFVLLMFGLILEKNIGSFKFLFVYLLSGIIGNYTQVILFENSIVLGASGALFGILGATMMRTPLLDIRVFGFLKVPLIILLGSFFTISFLVGIYFNLDFLSGDIAHFTGFLIGVIVIGFFYIDSVYIFYNWLFITFGFLIILYSLRFFLLFDTFNFKLVSFLFLMIIFGLFIIYYSYFSLKRVIVFRGQEE